jgi:site-specific recombinase XerD
VVDIRRRDIRELVERKAQTSPIQGNRVLDRISAMFTFAVDQDWIESNPAWRIKKPGQERSRDRVLTRDELRELWPALHEIPDRINVIATKAGLDLKKLKKNWKRNCHSITSAWRMILRMYAPQV